MTFTEKNNNSDTVAYKVESISWAMVDAHFRYAFTYRLYIAKVAECYVSQASVNSGNRTAVLQPMKPPLECSNFDDFNHANSVNCSSRTVK